MRKPLFVVALALAVVAGLLQWMFARSLEKQYRPGVPTQLLVAKVPLAPGTKVTRAHLEVREFPQNYARKNAVGAAELFAVDGRLLMTAVQPGDALLWSDLEGGDGSRRKSVGELVPRGQRALTISVDRSSSAGGNLRPDDRVDVFATLPRPGGDEVTIPLLQNVIVLATGAEVGRDASRTAASEKRDGFLTAAVLVTPEEAQRLTLAQSKGRLSLVVRNADDSETFDTLGPVGMNDLFNEETRNTIQRKRNETIEQIVATRRR